ncbi:MAG: VWA domain-containing protein [Clostridia bacterium]|nr:VWA domain-containing protein [Clostridia bacterium]
MFGRGFLRLLILLLVFIVSLSGCGSKNSNDENQEDKIASETGDSNSQIGQTSLEDSEYGFVLDQSPKTAVWKFAGKEESPWTGERPLINPMGPESAYGSIEYDANGSLHFEGFDKRQYPYEREIFGSLTKLGIPYPENFDEDQNAQFIDDLKIYIKENNWEIVAQKEKSVLFLAIDESQNKWWGKATTEDFNITLEVVLERELKIGAVMSLDPSDMEQPYRFSSYHSGNEYQVLKAFVSNGYADLNIMNRLQNGEFTWTSNHRIILDEYIGKEYWVGDLSNVNGVSEWELWWDSSDPPDEIRLEINSPLPMEPVIYGEAFGAIKVSAAFVSSIEASPTGGDRIYIEHPGYITGENLLDRTPDGDYLVYVPSGYWNLKISPEGDPLLSHYQIIGVPVNSGGVTEVNVPYTVALSLSKKSGSVDERGLEINNVKELPSEKQVAFQFTLLDKKTADIKPDKTNTTVTEGGVPANVIEIGPVETPPDLVILLDSSGSMRGAFEGVMEAASRFISGLPDDSHIRVIDFDTTVKVMDGENKNEALSALKKMSVGGDTALYNSLHEAMKLLDDAERPLIVLFTDGENDLANPGPNNKMNTLGALKEAKIPVFAIGFGKGQDIGTLKAIADESFGRYFDAQDHNALESVFKAINERIGNMYEVVYERPSEPAFGDIPVLTFMIDTSGSMADVDEGVGERMHNVRQLVHPFISALPDMVQAQLMGFEDSAYMVQSLTTDKTKLMRALESLGPGGPTDIPAAVHVAIESLKEIPSTRKILIFITDEALDPDESFMDEYFKAFIDEGISVLWVGMGLGESVEDVFALAAEKSGGSYVFSSDPKVLSSAFDQILKSVLSMKKSQLSQLGISIEKENELGEREAYSTAKLVELSAAPHSGKVIDSQTISYHYAGRVVQYGPEMAKKITGRSIPSLETIISGRMEVSKHKTGNAVKISVDELIFLDRLKGVDAPSGYRFMCATLEIENVMKPQKVTLYEDGSSHPSNWISGDDSAVEVEMIPSYLIPEMTAHFFVTMNNKGSHSASNATWLTADSIVNPGDPAILIEPEHIVSGTMVFIVPDEPIEQLSIHLYDTAYGSLHLPLIGKLPPAQAEIESLPTETQISLSDSFGLAFVGLEDKMKFPGDESIKVSNLFRAVQGTFISKMQALIDFNPSERLYLEVLSGSGSYYFNLHPTTAIVPYGQYYPKMIGPGAQNLTQWIFEMPQSLAKAPANLYINLRNDDARMPIVSGKAQNLTPKNSYKGEGYNLIVNSAIQLESSSGGVNGGDIILDVTIEDLEDGLSTQGVNELFTVSMTKDSGEIVEAYTSSNSYLLLLALDGESVIFDGTSRRGFLVYFNPDPEAQWKVTSDFHSDMSIPISSGMFPSELLVTRTSYETDLTFESDMSEAIATRINEYLMMKEGTTGKIAHTLNNEKVLSVVPPAYSQAGKQRMDEVKTVDQALKLLKSLKFIPTKRWLAPFTNIYSPEATVTQGFGTENDYAILALKLFSQIGLEPKMRLVGLTKEGKSALMNFSGGVDVIQNSVPAIYYEDKNGSHVLVLPFVEYLDDLESLAFYMKQPDFEMSSDRARIHVEIEGISLVEDMNEQFSDFSDALAGDTEDGPRFAVMTVLEESFSMSALSDDALDVGFTLMGTKVKAYWLNKEGVGIGEEGISLKTFEPKKVIIEIDAGGDNLHRYEASLGAERGLEDLFFTIAINSPEMPLRPVIEKIEGLEDLSAMRLYTRSILHAFIHAQTLKERAMAKDLDLVIGNTNRSRIIVVQMKAPTSKFGLETSISLLSPVNEVHTGDEKALWAFNIMSGYYATALEDAVLGQKGIGVIDIISAAPKGSKLVLMDRYLEGQDEEMLKKIGMSEEMIRYFENSDQMILIPSAPSIIGGEKRWAWIEMDPETYETIGVLDTFERGGMVSSVIVDSVRAAGQYVVGGFVGINTSIWSVAGFSLKEDDYATIMKEAQAFALGLKDSFGFSAGPVGASIGGKINISQQFGPVEASFDGSFNLSQNVLGFTQGYEDGVNYYFSKSQ